MIIDRQEIIKQLLLDLEATLRTKKQAYDEAVVASKEAPGRMESRYDSGKEDMARMADSIDKLVYETAQQIEYFQKLLTFPVSVDPVQEGSLVVVQDSQEKFFLFLLTRFGGGEKIRVGDQLVSVVSVEAPLGKLLLGRLIGEVVPGCGSEMRIVQIA